MIYWLGSLYLFLIGCSLHSLSSKYDIGIVSNYLGKKSSLVGVVGWPSSLAWVAVGWVLLLAWSTRLIVLWLAMSLIPCTASHVKWGELGPT